LNSQASAFLVSSDCAEEIIKTVEFANKTGLIKVLELIEYPNSNFSNLIGHCVPNRMLRFLEIKHAQLSKNMEKYDMHLKQLIETSIQILKLSSQQR
jgi:hypothetical protein